MTISYQRDVASSTAGGFTRLLFKWKGSLYKLIYRELLLFMSAYVLLSLVYRQLLTTNQRGLFETVVKYFDAFLNLIPLSFVLGFYVSYVASRWWQQFLAIPWPDKLFHSIACFVDGFDEDSRILRRSLMRYMNLALILVLRSISSAVKQRFPTLDHVVEAGFMTIQEKELFQAVPCNEFNTYWIPCTWFVFRLQQASKKGKLVSNYALETIMREFCEFRAKCGLLWCYDWVSIPMVYTQVVTLATYVFFIFTVIGRQKIDSMKTGTYMRSGRLPMDIDLYIPIFTILQFFFYMGLLKVAEQLINPFGDDDEDFELNWLIDRHMKASFLGCDILMDPDRIPPMVKDYYWDKQNCPIPYTEASMHFKRKTYKGSADDMIVPESKQYMVLPEIEEEAEEDDESSKRLSKLSLTSLLLDSTHLVTGTSVGLDQFSQKTSQIITNIGLGHSASNSTSSVDQLEGQQRVGQLLLSTAASRRQRPSLPDGRLVQFANEGEVEASPVAPARQYTPGSWRNSSNKSMHNGHTGDTGKKSSFDSISRTDSVSKFLLPENPLHLLRRLSDTNLTSLWNTSVDSMASPGGVDDDDDSDARRGSGASSERRRGSKITDLLEKKAKKKRKKDKQGFIWRRMIHHDHEDLPRTRIPRLGQVAVATATAMAVDPSVIPVQPDTNSNIDHVSKHDLTSNPDLQKNANPAIPSLLPIRVEPLKGDPGDYPSTNRGNISKTSLSETKTSTSPSQEDDSASVNSFKTCPSELSLGGNQAIFGGLVPRQVSDNYETRVLGPSGVKIPVRPMNPTRVITRSNAYAADPPRSRTRSSSGSGGSMRSATSLTPISGGGTLAPVSEDTRVLTRKSVSPRRNPSSSGSTGKTSASSITSPGEPLPLESKPSISLSSQQQLHPQVRWKKSTE